MRENSRRGPAGRPVRLAVLLAAGLALPAPGGADSGPSRSPAGGRAENAQAEAQPPPPREVTPPRLSLRREDVDLENCIVHWSISRDAVRIVVEVRGLRGDLMHSRQIELPEPVRAGTRLEATWPPQTEQIGRIEVTTYDEQEANVMFRISPFRVEIPHQDVVFETNKWEIRESERPKLDEAWALIAQAMEDYGNLLEAKLYVAGFTDTVDDARHNQTLSENRAQAIAAYFSAKGMTFPIYARGFGEHCLAVETEDSVDCEANRRATYVLAYDPPVMCPTEGSGSWRRVR